MAQCRVCGRNLEKGLICPACAANATQVPWEAPPVRKPKETYPPPPPPAPPAEGFPKYRSLRWVAHLALWPGVALLGLAFFAKPGSGLKGLEILFLGIIAFGVCWLVAFQTVQRIQKKGGGGGDKGGSGAP